MLFCHVINPPFWSTIMDKRLGTNLHLWCFFTRTEQSCTNSTTLALRHLQCWTSVHAISPNFKHCIGWGGGVWAETNFEKNNSAFSNSILKIQIIYAMTQVSWDIFSTIVACKVKVAGYWPRSFFGGWRWGFYGLQLDLLAATAASSYPGKIEAALLAE